MPRKSRQDETTVGQDGKQMGRRQRLRARSQFASDSSRKDNMTNAIDQGKGGAKVQQRLWRKGQARGRKGGLCDLEMMS